MLEADPTSRIRLVRADTNVGVTFDDRGVSLPVASKESASASAGMAWVAEHGLGGQSPGGWDVDVPYDHGTTGWVSYLLGLPSA